MKRNNGIVGVPRAAIYARLSDEDRNKTNVNDESESIQNQRNLLIKHCMEHHFDIVEIYCDEDYTGGNTNRPDFQRMIADCEAGKIDIVVAKSQSRFSRDLGTIEMYLHNKFPEWGVQFIGVADHTDSFDDNGLELRQMKAIIDQTYLKQTSQNIRCVLEYKRRDGKFTGSFAPYGYIIDPEDNNHLLVDDTAADVVRQIFEMFAAGYGYRKICQKLNESGVPCPSAYKAENNSSYRNLNHERRFADEKSWTHTTIARMVRNETYIGNLVQGKTHPVSFKNKKRKRVAEEDWIRAVGTHEPIISPDLWNKAQDRVKSSARSSRITLERTPLSGKVKCGVCGAGMKRNVYYNKDRSKAYYNLTCGTYKSGAMTCPNHRAMSGMQLEAEILARLNAILDRYYDVQLIEEDTERDNVKSKLLKQCQKIRREMSVKERSIAKTFEQQENMSAEMCQKLFSIYQGEYDKLKESLAEVEEQLQRLEAEALSEEQKRALLDKYKHIDQLTALVADEFIDTVYIGNFNEDGSRDITIKWKI